MGMEVVMEVAMERGLQMLSLLLNPAMEVIVVDMEVIVADMEVIVVDVEVIVVDVVVDMEDMVMVRDLHLAMDTVVDTVDTVDIEGEDTEDIAAMEDIMDRQEISTFKNSL